MPEAERTEKTYEETPLEEVRDRIITLLDAKKYIRARQELLSLNEADAAEVIEETENRLGIEMAIILFRMLPKDESAEVFSRLSSDDQQGIIARITDKEVGSIIAELDFDDMIDVLEELPANIVDKILAKATREERKLINTFLNYPEDSAGSIMTPDYIELKQDWTVGEALAHIKRVGMDSETVYTCYVKDRGRRLLGLVSLRSLVTNEGDVPLANLMVEDAVFVNVFDDREVVSEAFKKYGFLAMPVVDNEKRLVGIITVDDILDVIEEETTEDIERMGGVIDSSDKEYFDTGIFHQVKSRLPWLIVLMVSAMFTGMVIAHFETTLAKVTSLAIYLPLLMGTGGNSGSQASTLVIRGLAVGEIELKDAPRVLFRELRIGLIVAASLSAINLCKIHFLDHQSFQVAITACGAQLIIIVIAKCLGGLLPLLAKKIGIDPALMAAPFISSLTDTFACFAYFTLASMMFHI
ncbi:MAG: magnesium transporter [Clostridiales Family XIII bacterium]|jgi:magnesium transporter|nr:magnesium transporter [Clostridiales Family XIII bacterium]